MKRDTLTHVTHLRASSGRKLRRGIELGTMHLVLKSINTTWGIDLHSDWLKASMPQADSLRVHCPLAGGSCLMPVVWVLSHALQVESGRRRAES